MTDTVAQATLAAIAGVAETQGTHTEMLAEVLAALTEKGQGDVGAALRDLAAAVERNTKAVERLRAALEGGQAHG